MKCQNCRHKIIAELEDRKTITIRKDADCQPRDLTLRMKGKRETVLKQIKMSIKTGLI